MKQIDFLFLVSSMRNISMYYLAYLVLKFIIDRQMEWETFMRYYQVLIIVLFIAGMVSSNLIKKKLGSFFHFRYLKYEVIVVIFLIIFFEMFANKIL